jgi:hypothetical protein
MGARLKDRSFCDVQFGTHVNRESWNGEFWKEVYRYLQNEICPLDLRWKVTLDEEHGNGDTKKVVAYIIPSTKTILTITNTVAWRADNNAATQPVKTASVKKCLTRPIGEGVSSWFSTWKHLLVEPLQAVLGVKTGGSEWDFPLLMSWMSAFRLLIAVDCDKEIARLLKFWGNGSFVKGKSTPAVINEAAAKKAGIVRCRCGDYLQRGNMFSTHTHTHTHIRSHASRKY